MISNTVLGISIAEIHIHLNHFLHFLHITEKLPTLFFNKVDKNLITEQCSFQVSFQVPKLTTVF